MLRNVLGDYLNNVKERDFDLPFMTLLPAMDFYDVHFTHGQVEFGKDFIAKRVEDGVEIQYSFQSKAGDIRQADWRNDVMGQMLESVLTGLSHPCFDRDLPHQAVLVTTGRLKGNAALGLQDLNGRIKDRFNAIPVALWDQEKLIDRLEAYGLGGIYRATASGFVSYGNFYVLYGRSLQGNLSEREIERHSRYWLDGSLDSRERLLGAAIEAEMIAARCVEHGFFYEAIHALLSALRVILHDLYRAEDPREIKQLQEIYDQAVRKLYSRCSNYFSEVKQRWLEAEKDLVRIIEGPGVMMTYPVHCARILELTGCLYFMESDNDAKEEIASFIQDFILREPGSAHIPSDRYAVSLVLPTIALYDSSWADSARELLHRAAVWLCDRYQEGFGLASSEAAPYTEVTTLFGYPFEFVSEKPSGGSFLASVICDLAAFLGDKQFYSDVVNDIKACRIFPLYWQALDTVGQFRIEGTDVITYPNVQYEDVVTEFDSFEFAEHIVHEPRSFRLAQIVGPLGFMTLMLLLRDRYFPTIWPSLIQKRS